MVLDFTSGRRVTSPYDLLTGSYWNSSGTMQIQMKRMQLNLRSKKKTKTHKSKQCISNSKLTLIYPEAKIAFPFFAVHKVHKWIDIRST